MTPESTPRPLLADTIGLLARTRRLALAGSLLPLPLAALAVLAVRHFDPAWSSNLFLLAILAVFGWGQAVALVHLLRLARRARIESTTLAVLQRSGARPDPASLAQELSKLPAGHLRDLVLGWVSLPPGSAREAGESLFENARERREIGDHRIVAFHASINRHVLKIGFLGTLIGLLLTFPPMKRAILGLSDSGGEMRFIRDIAAAIDEDAYAILATLVATGFSLLLEALVVQSLERLLDGFALVDLQVADWRLAHLAPALDGDAAARTRADEALADRIEELRRRQEESWRHLAEEQLKHQARLQEAQALLDRQLKALTEQGVRTGEMLEASARAQDALARRVSELAAFEKDYRAFLSAKQAAAAPAQLRPEA